MALFFKEQTPLVSHPSRCGLRRLTSIYVIIEQGKATFIPSKGMTWMLHTSYLTRPYRQKFSDMTLPIWSSCWQPWTRGKFYSYERKLPVSAISSNRKREMKQLFWDRIFWILACHKGIGNQIRHCSFWSELQTIMSKAEHPQDWSRTIQTLYISHAIELVYKCVP